MSHMSLRDGLLSRHGYLGAGCGEGGASEELLPPERRPTMSLVSPRLSRFFPLCHLHPQLLLPRMY